MNTPREAEKALLEAQRYPKGVDERMPPMLIKLMGEGIGRTIMNVRHDVNGNEEEEIIGIVLPCSSPGKSKDTDYALAFSSGTFYRVSPPKSEKRQWDYASTFGPDIDPIVVKYNTVAKAEHHLMDHAFPHSKRTMESTAVPAQAEGVITAFCEAVDVARTLKHEQETARAMAVGRAALACGFAENA